MHFICTLHALHTICAIVIGGLKRQQLSPVGLKGLRSVSFNFFRQSWGVQMVATSWTDMEWPQTFSSNSPAPPVILQGPETVSLSRGNTARFLCNSSGEPPPVLHWLKNGQPIKSFRRVKTQSPGVLLINQLALEDAGYYQCIAENWLGTACATARLTVIVREGLPSPPRHLSATPYSSTTALLSWEKPEYNSDQIIGYSVHCHSTAGLSLCHKSVYVRPHGKHAYIWFECFQLSGSDNGEYEFAMNNDTTEYLFRELLPHTTYTLFVVAYSPMGASSPSLPITVEMLEDGE